MILRMGESMNRREFLTALSAAALVSSIDKATSAAPPATAATSAPAKQAYKHRVQFGCWINDMRNEVLPRTNWPASLLDESAERDIIDTLTLGHESGYNQMD